MKPIRRALYYTSMLFYCCQLPFWLFLIATSSRISEVDANIIPLAVFLMGPYLAPLVLLCARYQFAKRLSMNGELPKGYDVSPHATNASYLALAVAIMANSVFCIRYLDMAFADSTHTLPRYCIASFCTGLPLIAYGCFRYVSHWQST